MLVAGVAEEVLKELLKVLLIDEVLVVVEVSLLVEDAVEVPLAVVGTETVKVKV